MKKEHAAAPDYSDSLLDIMEMRRMAQQACLKKDWNAVAECADHILAAAYNLKIYSMQQLNEVLDKMDKAWLRSQKTREEKNG